MLARAQVAREAGEEEHGNANHAETRELVVRAYGRAMSASIELNHLAAEAGAVQRALLVHDRCVRPPGFGALRLDGGCFLTPTSTDWGPRMGIF